MVSVIIVRAEGAPVVLVTSSHTDIVSRSWRGGTGYVVVQKMHEWYQIRMGIPHGDNNTDTNGSLIVCQLWVRM